MRRALLFLILLLPMSAVRAEDASTFFFKDGDRIVFLGDSITEQFQYSSDIELYLTTRFPRWNLTFLNAGIGGDTATGGARRFASHVLAEKPTAVTINFGMNDAGYGAFNPGVQANFIKNTEAMLKAAKQGNVRVALLSPNAVDRRIQDRFKLYVETQKQFYAPLSELAARYSATFVDQYAVTRAGLEKMEAAEAKDVKPYYDGFHTASPGGLFMAHAILTGLKAPALVSNVEIDAAASKAKTTKCTVEEVKATEKGITFRRTDEALPLPVQSDWVSLLPFVNNLKDLNWYGLKVTGLAAGSYTLAIDGKEVGRYTADDLAAGVNLGNLTTGPLHEQGQKVFTAINAKNKLVHQRFRGVVMYDIPEWLADVGAPRKAAELEKRLTAINAAQAEIYKLAKPVPHRFELKPAS